MDSGNNLEKDSITDTSKKFCSVIFDVMQEKGVKDIVCSPGSRNVPLLLAAAARKDMRKHFVADERSAAFMALGLAMVSRKPVAIVCTSGTALLNYSPAVAEAFYQGIPLIVISADRPIQWIDQDDSQTLRQDNALANFVKQSYSVPALGEDSEEMLWYVNRITNDALLMAAEKEPGPVHINIHLGEPLGRKIDKEENTQRIIREIHADTISNKEVIKNLAKEISEKKVMLVAGFSSPKADLQKAVADFCRRPNVAVMAETISNLHLNEDDFSVDSVLTAYPEELLDEYAPDIVISIGGALVSRKLKEYLRRNKERCRHWAVDYSRSVSDPFMSLSLKIDMDKALFFRGMNVASRKLKVSEKAASYQEVWRNLRLKAREAKGNFIKDSEWSELKAFDFLLKNIPSDYNLCLSNGTPIRYAQIIDYPLPHASYCNRGVSGIDGTLSTAVGAAKSFKGKTLLITGDLSMAYDIGGLGLRDIPSSFKLVVIDNQGGGIFRFITSISSLEEREEYLCQTPLLPLRHLADGYGWNYFECKDEKSLPEIFKEFLASRQKSILKISCDGEISARILKDYMNLKTD